MLLLQGIGVENGESNHYLIDSTTLCYYVFLSTTTHEEGEVEGDVKWRVVRGRGVGRKEGAEMI